MKRLVLAIVAALFGWFVLQQAQSHGWKGISLPGLLGGSTSTDPPPARGNRTSAIGTFNVQVLGESKVSDRGAIQAIVGILRNFDVIAIQEVRAVSQDILPQLMAYLNGDGRHYDYAIGPRLGRTSSKE